MRTRGRLVWIRAFAAVGALGALSLLHPVPVSSLTLYDVDFGSPTNVVGAPPTVGAGPFPRDTPSEITLGAPLVAGSLGPLQDQPLVFRNPSLGQIEQVAFDLGLGLSRYRVELDLVIDGLLDDPSVLPTTGFHLHFDPFVFPSSVAVRLQGDGRVRFGGFGDPVIGSFTAGEVLRLGATLDLDAHELSIFLDGELAHVADYPSPDLARIRLGTQLLTAPDALVGVDDIRITPEPGTAPLLMAGLLALAASGRRRARRAPARRSERAG